MGRYPWVLVPIGLATLCSGCGGGHAAPVPAVGPTAATVELIPEADRTRHLGVALGTSGRTLEYRYRLVNRSDQAVRIVEVINRKSCCGVVAVDKQALGPGETADVAVTVHVGDRFGEVVHEALVVTDPPAPRELLFRTIVKVCPPLRVEDVRPPDATAPGDPGGPERQDLLVTSYGTADEPPVDLVRLVPVSTERVEWAGPPERAATADGLTVMTRRLVAHLDRGGAPGRRKAALALRDGDLTVYERDLGWRVMAPIEVSPKMVPLRPGKAEHRLLLRATDGRAFRITRVECDLAGVRAVAPDAAAALHVVEVEDARAGNEPGGRGTLTIHTDHPAQGRLDISIVSIQ